MIDLFHRQLKKVLKDDAWRSAEATLAEQFGLALRPAGKVLGFIQRSLDLSDFNLAELKDEFDRHRDQMIEFGRRWYADCTGHDYGEEWDPEEGNQQDPEQKTQVIGMSEGFMVGYGILFLYAKYKPGETEAYAKRRRTPHAAKVARDVIRVYCTLKTTTPNEEATN